MMQKIEISHKTVIFIAVFLFAVWLLIEIKDIILLLFISFIIMSALRPLVEFFEKYRIPRALSILGVYVLLVGAIGVALSSLVPPLVNQTARLITNLPKYMEQLSPYINVDVKSVTNQIAPISQNIVMVTLSVFSNIIAALTVGVFTFYLLLERGRLKSSISKMLARQSADNVLQVVESIEVSLGTWLRGQLLLMIIVGVLTYLGLVFLKVDYALPLAILAGFFEIVPVIGPIFSAIPAVFIAATTSPFLALSAAALYFIIQQLENQLIVPYVMNRAVGLPPLIIIISLMIGSRLAGIIGTILSIPVVIMLRAIIVNILYKEPAVKTRSSLRTETS